MCALRRRAETGHGEQVEIAQSENMMQHIGEYFIDADRTGRSHGPGGNRHVSRAPQGCYRCTGDDRWVVISVAGDAEWLGLCRAMGQETLSSDERFDSLSKRQANHDELDEIIGAWTADLDRWRVFELCQNEGVAAGPVLDEADAYADPHLRERGFSESRGRSMSAPGSSPANSGAGPGPDMKWGPICSLGDSNEYVYKEILGFDDEAYAELDAKGHLSLDYLKPDGTSY